MKQFKSLTICTFFISVLTLLLSVQGIAQNSAFQVHKIWDQAPHNAFTDLIRFNDKFYCTFREGTGHVPGENGKDGEIRIIASEDGKQWESVALLQKENYDLRDAKLSITPEGKLMVLMGGTDYDGNQRMGMLTHVSFSKDGRNFSDPSPIKINRKVRTHADWLWRVTWHQNTGYGVVYQSEVAGGESEVYLLKTKNGKKYKPITRLNIDGRPNEATVRIKPNGEMFVIIRREGKDQLGFFGKSQPPYEEWKWQGVGMRLGGPDFIILPDGNLLIGSRVYGEDGATTGLFLGDQDGNMQQIITFPSGGDTSYPGLLLLEDTLYVSYYSSHERKANIYFTSIPLSEVKKTDN